MFDGPWIEVPLSRARSRAGRDLGNRYSVSDVTAGKGVTGIPTGTVVTAAVSATASTASIPAASIPTGAGAGAFTSWFGGVACQDDLDCREVDCLVLCHLSRSCDVECELGANWNDRAVVGIGDRGS